MHGERVELDLMEVALHALKTTAIVGDPHVFQLIDARIGGF